MKTFVTFHVSSWLLGILGLMAYERIQKSLGRISSPKKGPTTTRFLITTCFPHHFPTDPKKTTTAAFVAYFMPLVLRPVAVIRPPEMRRNRMAWFRFQRFRWGKKPPILAEFDGRTKPYKNQPRSHKHTVGKMKKNKKKMVKMMIKFI